MRIIAGAAKGRPIKAPPSRLTRPTTDRTRESLFSILTSRSDLNWEDCRVMDVFAGSGALGLEAVSRGASFAFFVDADHAACQTIRGNVRALEFHEQTQIIRRDIRRLGPRPSDMGEAFNLIFLDPPYGKGLVEPALGALLEGGWVAGHALLVIEESVRTPIAPVNGLAIADERIYGDTKIVILTRQSP